MQLDVITVGNAIIDAFLSLQDANEHVHLDKAKKEFRLTAGEKIQLENCIFEIGGNACNVAVGLSRLGFSTGLLAEIGDDAFSETIMKRLSDEEVYSGKIQRKGQSSFAIALNLKGERTLLVEHVDREHAFTFYGVKAHCIYLTSMGQKWQNAYHMVLDYVKNHDTFFVMNPGTKQLQEAPGFIRGMLPHAQILFINKEEGLRLIGQSTTKRSMSYLLDALRALGPDTVVVTDGDEGSYAMDASGKSYHALTLRVPVIEKTGAGDAYSTGFLAAMLSGKDITEAMRWGTLSATGVIGKIGAQPGLLTRKQLHDYLEDDNQVKVNEIAS